MKKIFGFTLTEMLIAVAIVGIVSALTVPAVVNRFQKDQYVLALKKVYVDLQQNLDLFQTENYRAEGDLSRSTLTTEDGVENFLKKYFKISKNCGDNPSGCFASEYYSISGDSDNTLSDLEDGKCILTKGGYAIYIISVPEDNDCTLDIYVDTNGTEGPNIGGRDMFAFHVYNDYTIDVVKPPSDNSRNTLYSSNCNTSPLGVGCFGKIYNDEWKMNY